MKKYNYLLSALMVPAVVFGTCTGGTGGGSTSVSLPTSVTGIQSFSYSTASLYNFAVSAGGGAITAGNYSAWCTDPNHAVIPGGGTNYDGSTQVPEDPKNATGSAVYTPVNSYSITGTGTTGTGNAYGVAGYTFNGTGYTTTKLSLTQEWSAVNWVINHPAGVSKETPTSTDVQNVIWQLLHPETYYGTSLSYLVVSATDPKATVTNTPNSFLLYQDALANGLSFTPSTGDLVAILMLPAATNPTYQGFIIGVPIVCTTATGSLTLTKTSNVGAAGANAFQLVTYTYTITNTGSTTLQDFVIVDDNGTPAYKGDDVTINLPAGTTLASGKSISVTNTVYLPITLFYQSGSQAAFDTLIPQVIPATPATVNPTLLLTYLIDSDVTDNYYGKNASNAWQDNGGHTIAQVEAGFAEFGLYDSAGNLVGDFKGNYIAPVGVSTSVPSGLASSGVIGTPAKGNGSNFVIDSTLANNLNNFPQFVGNTVDSPVAGTANWQGIAGYKVYVNEGAFGVHGLGSAKVLQNYLANTKSGYSGKCGSSRAATYVPCIYGDVVTSTATVVADVCGCTTVIHASTCLTVKLCGATKPGCNSSGNHDCQKPTDCSCSCSNCRSGLHGNCSNKTWWGAPAKCSAPVCGCPCAQCKAGNHKSCSQVGCTDSRCHTEHCGHDTVICKDVTSGKTKSLCW